MHNSFDISLRFIRALHVKGLIIFSKSKRFQDDLKNHFFKVTICDLKALYSSIVS